MFMYQRFVPGLAIASYIIGDEKAKRAAVIDPTRDVDEYIRIALAEGRQITHVLETHVHADYVSGAAELKARLAGRARVVCRPLCEVLSAPEPTYELYEHHRSYGAGINEYATRVGADLVVLGTRGRTNLRDVLMGSTAERVVRNTPCSVLAVKPGGLDGSAAPAGHEGSEQ